MKIGLFFGSFNPIHSGHIAVANYILENTAIKEVWFVVSPLNPFKKDTTLLDEKERLRLVRLAIKGNKRIKASDIEFDLSRPSFTIKTLDVLKANFPLDEFCIIMGSDILLNFNSWKDYRRIMKENTIYVYRRAGKTKRLRSKNIIYLNSPEINVSSTTIRKLIKLNKSVKDYLPAPVLKRITTLKLYSTNNV